MCRNVIAFLLNADFVIECVCACVHVCGNHTCSSLQYSLPPQNSLPFNYLDRDKTSKTADDSVCVHVCVCLIGLVTY